MNDKAVLDKTAELNKVSADEFGAWLQDALIFKSAKESLDAMATAEKTAKDIDAFLAANGGNVPASAKALFGPNPGKGSPFDASLLKAIGQ